MMLNLKGKEITALICGSPIKDMPKNGKQIQDNIQAAISKAIEDGYKQFITCGFPGVETWAAQYIINNRKETKVKLCLLKPNYNFYRDWKNNEGIQYQVLYKKCNYILTADDWKNRESFHSDISDMIRHSNKLICFYNKGIEDYCEFAARQAKQQEIAYNLCYL